MSGIFDGFSGHFTHVSFKMSQWQVQMSQLSAQAVSLRVSPECLKRTWASRNLWHSTSSSQNCFILLILYWFPIYCVHMIYYPIVFTSTMHFQYRIHSFQICYWSSLYTCFTMFLQTVFWFDTDDRLWSSLPKGAQVSFRGSIDFGGGLLETLNFKQTYLLVHEVQASCFNYFETSRCF